MGVYKKRGKWFIDYYYHGHRIRESIGNKRVAEKALAVRKSQIAQGKFDLQDLQPSITFSALEPIYMEFAKANKKSWKRDEVSLKNLVPYFGNKRLNEISSFLVEKYKQKRAKEIAPASVNRELALVKYMFNLAIRWKKAKVNPVREVKLFREDNRRVRFLSEDEIHRLLECSSPQLRPIVLAGVSTGMRRGELFSLKWKNVSFERNEITVEKTKSGKSRKIPINDVLKGTLLGLPSRNKHEYVFLNSNGMPYKDIRTTFKTALLRAGGLEGVTMIHLRHTFASHLVMAGVDLTTVAELLGHQNIQTTITYYAHLSARHKQQAVNVLQRRLRLTSGHHMDTIADLDKVKKAQKPYE